MYLLLSQQKVWTEVPLLQWKCFTICPWKTDISGLNGQIWPLHCYDLLITIKGSRSKKEEEGESLDLAFIAHCKRGGREEHVPHYASSTVQGQKGKKELLHDSRTHSDIARKNRQVEKRPFNWQGEKWPKRIQMRNWTPKRMPEKNPNWWLNFSSGLIHLFSWKKKKRRNPKSPESIFFHLSFVLASVSLPLLFMAQIVE